MMRLDVYLPLLFTALFGQAAPRLGRRLPPAVATWLFTASGAICATGSLTALALLGWTLVGDAPEVAARERVSAVALRQDDPVPQGIALAAIVVAAAILLRTAWVLGRRVAALRAAYRIAGDLPGGELVVVDDPGLPACVIPGRAGRVVLPRPLLCRLDAPQRRALIAHEAAHLRYRHHLHHAAIRAAAANPLLRRLQAATALATERWADEYAARRSSRAASLRPSPTPPAHAGPRARC